MLKIGKMNLKELYKINVMLRYIYVERNFEYVITEINKK